MQEAIDLAKGVISKKDYLQAEKICKENFKDPAFFDIYLPMIFSKDYMKYKNIATTSKMYHHTMYEYCGAGSNLTESQITFKFRLSTYYADNFDEFDIQSPEKQQIAEWERKVKSLEEIHSVTNVEPWMIIPIDNKVTPSKDAILRVVDPNLECNSTIENIDSIREYASPLSPTENTDLRYRRPSLRDLTMRQSSRSSMLQTRTSMLGSKGIASSRASMQGSRASISSSRSSILSLQSISGEQTLSRKPSAIDRLSKKFADSSISLNSHPPASEMVSIPVPIDLGDELPPCREDRKHSRSSMMQKKASRNSLLTALSAITTPDPSTKNSFASSTQIAEIVDAVIPPRAGIEETLEAMVTVKRNKKAADIAAVEEKMMEAAKLVEAKPETNSVSITDMNGQNIGSANGLICDNGITNTAPSFATSGEAKRSKTKFSSVMVSITKQKPTAEEIRNHRLHR